MVKLLLWNLLACSRTRLAAGIASGNLVCAPKHTAAQRAPVLPVAFIAICCANEHGRVESETPGSLACGSCSVESCTGKGQQAFWGPVRLFCPSHTSAGAVNPASLAFSPYLTGEQMAVLTVTQRVAALLSSREHFQVSFSGSLL